MGESKHTPQWTLTRRDSDSVTFKISNGDRIIATKEVWLDLLTLEELAEVESELRTATAAPLMLEALRAIYAVARGTIEERAPLVAEQMYAAIKAATGGEWWDSAADWALEQWRKARETR